MAYFRTYTYSFKDNHNIHPAEWRVDILDDQASASTIPVTLIASAEKPPLSIERLDTSDDKATRIIGSQAVISYEYTGAAVEPKPELFGDNDERRFRVEVYKNGSLYGVWYVKPDFIEYDDKYPPYTVTLTAVDGLSFIKGVDWNAYDNGGLLSYERMSLYDIIMDRGLLQVLDSNTAINVINTLRPENIGGDSTLLNDLYIHSDMFIDFTKGPDKVADVLDKLLTSLYSRLIIAQNQVWIQRMPDLMQPSITAENYINGVYNPLPLPTAIRSIGPNISNNDGTPIDDFGRNISFPAIKQVSYTLDYKSINQLLNFQWGDFNGTDFDNWQRNLFAFTVSRHGAGSIDDPYTAFLPFVGEQSPDNPIYFLVQGSGVTPILVGNVGDIFEVSFRYKFTNTQMMYVNCYGLDTVTGETIALGSDGNWVYDSGDYPPVFTISRAGKKQDGSFELTSVPLPKIIGDHVLSGNPFQFFFGLHVPVGLNTLDGAATAGIDIYPVKLGIYSISSAGRNITDINNGRVSQVIDEQPYYFIDTGEANLSNTIFVDDTITPAEKWTAIGAPSDIQDLERHMADSNIDQYAKAVSGWSGSIYSNTIEFWHIFTMVSKPGKRFVLMNDKYDVRTCTHECNFQELLPENGADTTYQEFDIEDTND